MFNQDRVLLNSSISRFNEDSGGKTEARTHTAAETASKSCLTFNRYGERSRPRKTKMAAGVSGVVLSLIHVVNRSLFKFDLNSPPAHGKPSGS